MFSSLKHIDARLIGGILLVVGTSIGGGMLVLPVSLASTGFLDSTLFLVLSWFIMTTGALLLLEANLYLPKGTNIISMAKLTLGKWGMVLAWLFYLFLLYTLLSAYISGGSDVMHGILSLMGINIPKPLSIALYVLAFGSIVYLGMWMVDYFNRGLMFIKLGIYLLLVLLIAPHISVTYLSNNHIRAITSAMMVLVTSFSFGSIVPSLRDYFDDDIPRLRKIIIIGSLIPLFCYIAWNAALLGIMSVDDYAHVLASGHLTTALTERLREATHNLYITEFFRGFSVICLLTAFLAVSIGLFDFLADGLGLRKRGSHGIVVFFATFLPPTLLVLAYPNAYLYAIRFAGFCCVVLLLFLPALMTYRARYTLKLKTSYQVSGGKPLLFFAMFAAVTLMGVALWTL